MTMVIGRSIKPGKAEKALAKVAGDLLAGEVAWFFARCNNFRPMTDAVVVTNGRVIGLGTNGGLTFAALFSDIASTDYDEGRGTVTLNVRDGGTMTFKQVHGEDVRAIAHYVEHGMATGVPREVADAASQLPAEAPVDKDTARSEKRLQKQQERAERSQEKQAREADELDRYGPKIADELFGLRTVRIYENGYVRVSLPMFGRSAPFERLLAIEASSDVTKKTGLGRGAAAVATMGLNLASSNKRGDVYLTISTDATTHVLHEDPPTAMNMRQVKRLEAAGLSVIGRGTNDPGEAIIGPDENVASEQGTRTVGERLRELERLLQDGLISNEEYERMRGKVLGSL